LRIDSIPAATSDEGVNDSATPAGIQMANEEPSAFSNTRRSPENRCASVDEQVDIVRQDNAAAQVSTHGDVDCSSASQGAG
jgi:hypothetical protein